MHVSVGNQRYVLICVLLLKTKEHLDGPRFDLVTKKALKKLQK